MHILVTGGAGFIGSHLVETLLDQGHRVGVLDDFNDFYAPAIKRANLAAVQERIDLHEADLRDAATVAEIVGEGRYDAIIHLAARAGVRPSIADPQLYVDANITGTLNLLEAARRAGVRRFVFASSSSVYGLCKTVPFREDVPLPQTISPYAATKLAGEHLCSNYAHLYDLQVVCLRFFTVYGPRQRPDLAIHQFTRRIQRGLPIQQFGDGLTRRDYTYVDDTIQGVVAALGYQGPRFDVFNLGESQTTPLRDLIELIEGALEKRALIERLPEQPGDVPLTCADIPRPGGSWATGRPRRSPRGSRVLWNGTFRPRNRRPRRAGTRGSDRTVSPSAPAENVVELCARLVAIPSVNPSGDPGTSDTGRRGARANCGRLRDCGAAEVTLEDVLRGGQTS